MSIVLDLRKSRCPKALLETKRGIGALEVGQRLTLVLSDTAETDIVRYVEIAPVDVQSTRICNGQIEIELTKRKSS